MTVGFVRASKAYILPTVLDDVYRFRKAFLTIDSVLRSIFSAISATGGTAEAVSTLRGDYNGGSVDCQGLQPSGFSSDCPWGLLSFIQNAASSLGVDGTFSEAEVQQWVCALYLYRSRTRAAVPRSVHTSRCRSVYTHTSGRALTSVPVTTLDTLTNPGL